jgi:hypothetical protein
MSKQLHDNYGCGRGGDSTKQAYGGVLPWSQATYGYREHRHDADERNKQHEPKQANIQSYRESASKMDHDAKELDPQRDQGCQK